MKSEEYNLTAMVLSAISGVCLSAALSLFLGLPGVLLSFPLAIVMGILIGKFLS